MTTLSQKILCFIQPKTESQRREFRLALACASDHADELKKTACLLTSSLAGPVNKKKESKKKA